MEQIVFLNSQLCYTHSNNNNSMALVYINEIMIDFSVQSCLVRTLACFTKDSNLSHNDSGSSGVSHHWDIKGGGTRLEPYRSVSTPSLRLA